MGNQKSRGGPTTQEGLGPMPQAKWMSVATYKKKEKKSAKTRQSAETPGQKPHHKIAKRGFCSLY